MYIRPVLCCCLLLLFAQSEDSLAVMKFGRGGSGQRKRRGAEEHSPSDSAVPPHDGVLTAETVGQTDVLLGCRG